MNIKTIDRLVDRLYSAIHLIFSLDGSKIDMGYGSNTFNINDTLRSDIAERVRTIADINFEYGFSNSYHSTNSQSTPDESLVEGMYESFMMNMSEQQRSMAAKKDKLGSIFTRIKKGVNTRKYKTTARAVYDFTKYGKITARVDTEKVYNSVKWLRNLSKEFSDRGIKGAKVIYHILKDEISEFDKKKGISRFLPWKNENLEPYMGQLNYNTITTLLHYSPEFLMNPDPRTTPGNDGPQGGISGICQQAMSQDRRQPENSQSEYSAEVDCTNIADFCSADEHSGSPVMAYNYKPIQFDYNSMKKCDENWIVDQYINSGNTIKDIRNEFTEKTGMNISNGSFYRIIDRNTDGFRRSRRGIETLAVA